MTEQPPELKYEPVPPSAPVLFRMLWQLETWFRTMVYVELKAARTDWEGPIKAKVRDWPPNSLTKDKTQYHMATSHQEGISYLTFGELWNIMSDGANWPLFEPYFPPMANTPPARTRFPSVVYSLLSRLNSLLLPLCGKNRGNRTPVELFLADVAGWEPHIIRQVQAA